jgi:pimeloyl-ACP methyl ester carboxylesterase
MEACMLEKKIQDQVVSYTDNQSDKQAIVLLHGWGQSSELMMPIFDYFKKDFRVINLDLPGFGHSEDLKASWGVLEYTLFLNDFLKEIKVENPVIIAHSFGARIALLFSCQFPTRQLVLTGAAGIKPKPSLLVQGKIASYKIAKRIVKLPGLGRFEESMKKSFGSSDYKNASGFKRSSFVKIVNEDLKPILSKVKASTLLIWGEKDVATPLWMGQMMEKEIPDAGLVIFEEDDHYAYFHQMKRFNRIVDVFLSSYKEKE